jgi:hypothetical protein
MLINDIDNLKFQLNEGHVRVEFTKVDGTHRSMLCTKNFHEIPIESIPVGTNKKLNENILRVYDLEKQAWRSIRLDSIQSWANVENS